MIGLKKSTQVNMDINLNFPFEYSEEEIGGFGSVHLYIARKLTND